MSADTWRQGWLTHSKSALYGDLLYKRATGELPEMESSKATAAYLKTRIEAGDRLLDVGCGAGHYLRSLDKTINVPFEYAGLDATPGYVERARKAFAGRPNTRFSIDEIFLLKEGDASHDIVMCNNLLLHLPSIVKPLQELCRVARRLVLIRTLVGESSYRIQEILINEKGDEKFDERGEPKSFHYFNIYSRRYVEAILHADPRVRSVKIRDDNEFDERAIEAQQNVVPGNPNVTRMVDGRQVSGYIICPWSFIEIEIGAGL